MSDLVWEIKKRFTSPDGVFQAEIYASFDELLSFCELARREEENPSTEEIYTYWLPVLQGGLFHTIEEAEREMRASIPWLQNVDFAQI